MSFIRLKIGDNERNLNGWGAGPYKDKPLFFGKAGQGSLVKVASPKSENLGRVRFHNSLTLTQSLRISSQIKLITPFSAIQLATLKFLEPR